VVKEYVFSCDVTVELCSDYHDVLFRRRFFMDVTVYYFVEGPGLKVSWSSFLNVCFENKTAVIGFSSVFYIYVIGGLIYIIMSVCRSCSF
jgi:hypothetical protein